MVYDPNFPRRDSSTGCSPSLILALRTNALGEFRAACIVWPPPQRVHSQLF